METKIIKRRLLHIGFLTAIFILIAAIFFTPSSNANALRSYSSALENGTVEPENGVWGENFTFRVIYQSVDNFSSPVSSIKVHIDEMTLDLREENLLDENVSGEKVYVGNWNAGKEDVGLHSFFFTVDRTTGKYERIPANGYFEGPLVMPRSTEFIDFNVLNRDNYLVFSGKLLDNRNLNGISDKKVGIYKVLEENKSFLGEKKTLDNGSFELRYSNFENKGAFRFEASFHGDNFYRTENSEPVFVTSIDSFTFISLSIPFWCLLSLGAFLFFRIEDEYPALLLAWGVFFAAFFFIFLSRIFSGFIPGLAMGFFLGRYFHTDWKKFLKVGSMGGVFASVILSIIIFIGISIFDRTVRVLYSFNQSGFLLNHFISSSLLAVFLIGVGMAFGTLLGGFLRKLKDHVI